MDNLKNKFYKLLLSFFIISFIIFIFFYYKYSMGLFFDIPAMFLGCISGLDDNKIQFLVFNQNRVRFFNDFLVAIPLNFWINFIRPDKILSLLKIYSVSYFIVQIFALAVNCFIAKRTKRFDILIMCFAFYAIFCIPNAIWAVREVHISVLFYFALLSYFLSETKLQYKDIIPVLLLIIYMFESFETTIIYGSVLFIFSLLYTKKEREEKNPWFKVLIGFGSLLSVIYIPLKMVYFYIKGSLSFSSGASEWLIGSKIALDCMSRSNLIIPLFAVICFIFIVFYRKNSFIKSLILWSVYLCSLLFVLNKQTGFISDPPIEIQNYSIVFWFMFPVILIILLIDYFKIDVNKINPFFYRNLFILACLTGIINLGWQINSAYSFGKYTDYLKTLIKNSTETIVYIPKKDLEKYKYLRYNTCFGVTHKSLLLSDDYIVNKVIFPAEYYNDYSEFCFDSADYTYYNKKEDILYLQTTPIHIKTKYWDISPIAGEFEKRNLIKN